MKTLIQKQTYPIAPGLLLVLTVLACLRVMPILAQESSLLLPQRQPSELLLPALESALFQPTTGSSSFLKSQSFEVRDMAKQHKAGHDNTPRRLKSAASATPVAPTPASRDQVNAAKTQTPFPSLGAAPLTAQKPVASAAVQNTPAFKEVLQYDKTGLFALKLVRVPVVNEESANVTQATPAKSDVSASPVKLPSFLVSNGTTDLPALPSDTTTAKAEQLTQPVTKNVSPLKPGELPTFPSVKDSTVAPKLASADKSTQYRREGAALAAIGTKPNTGSSTAEKRSLQSSKPNSDDKAQTASPQLNSVVQKSHTPAVTNPLLIMPPNLSAATDDKATANAGNSQARKVQPQDAKASTDAPVPAMKNESFDLSSVALGYIEGGTLPEGKSTASSDKPIPPLEVAKETPWFTKLPKDDFLIGFDNEEEIGLAQSQIFIGPNGEVRDLPRTAKYVPLPTAGMNLPEEMQVKASEQRPNTSDVNNVSPATQPARTELVAVLPKPVVTPQTVAPSMLPNATPIPIFDPPKQKNQQAVSPLKQTEQSVEPQSEKTDLIAKLSFGKLKLKNKTNKAEKPSEHKATEYKTMAVKSKPNKAEQEAPVRKVEHSSATAPSGKSVTSLFSGLNPFAKKKTR